MPTRLFFLTLLGIFLVSSCSRKKDKFLNRSFHATTTYYNIVYNGNLELEQGKQQVENSYKEDYWKILPIERMEVKEIKPELPKPSNRNPKEDTNATPFQKAEEKATKAIQKHSMFMGGKEYNPQIDEAFLLLGKARYYDQRFVQAKDAFSFILNHYPESTTINEAKIWLEKTNLRLEYHEMAIGNLIKLLSSSTLSPEEQYEASSTLAQAYIYKDQFKLAIPPLRTAVDVAPDYEKKGRLLYIKGQLHSFLNEIDSARTSFDQVIALNRKPPRRYMIHSELEKLRLEGFENSTWNELESAFQELAEDRENRPFLDFIHYENAVFRLTKDSIELAIEKFNKSLRQNPEDNYLKSKNYLNLGEIYFDKASYETSGKYYDSTLTNLAETTLEYRQVKRKRDNLDEVIKFEGIVKTNDSILKLVNASEEERLKIFNSYIEELKEEEKSVFASQNTPKLGGSRFGAQQSQIGGRQANTTQFYFYDITQKERGEQNFKRTWGDIALEDDWRRNPKQTRGVASNNEEPSVEEDVYRPEFDPQTYIAQIPTDEKVIDSIKDETNFSNYQLGIIYKEKFSRNDLAIPKLTSLLENKPEERLILPSKYYLYKIYKDEDDIENANKWRENILSKHPDSRYASILRNPEAFRASADNPINIYNKLYKDYKAGYYESVDTEVDSYIQIFVGNAILPKLELLKARVTAKLDGAQAYLEALNYVALTYPQSNEGKYAQEKYNELKSKSFASEFDMQPTPDAEYLIVFDFKSDVLNTSQMQEFKNNLSSAIEEEEEGFQLKLNEDVYNKNQTLVTINGLRSEQGAIGLVEKLIESKKIDKSLSYFVITQKNYKIAQINKSLDQYLENYR